MITMNYGQKHTHFDGVYTQQVELLKIWQKYPKFLIFIAIKLVVGVSSFPNVFLMAIIFHTYDEYFYDDLQQAGKQFKFTDSKLNGNRDRRSANRPTSP